MSEKSALLICAFRDPETALQRVDRIGRAARIRYSTSAS